MLIIQGIDEAPDPRNVLSDGLDISIIGKVEEEEVLSKIGLNSPRGKKSKPKESGKMSKKPAKMLKRQKDRRLDDTTQRSSKVAKTSGRPKNLKTNNTELSTPEPIKATNLATVSTLINNEGDTTVNNSTTNDVING